MLSGDETETPTPVFVAPAGTYSLEPAVFPIGTCPAALPGFGWNQGAELSYLALGTG